MKKINLMMIMICMISIMAIGVLAFTNPVVTITSPASSSWSQISNVTFNFTVVGNASDGYNCTPWTKGNGSWYANSTNSNTNVSNNTAASVSYQNGVAPGDGFNDNNTGILWNIRCRGNASDNSSTTFNSAWGPNRSILIDTKPPTNTSIWNPANNTIAVDGTPNIIFNASEDDNFKRYVLRFWKWSDATVNVTTYYYFRNKTNGTNNVTVTLPELDTGYNFTIYAEDEAGHQSTEYLHHYNQSSVGWNLNAGWNIYSIVRDNNVNLSEIAAETGATIVAWYNNTNGTFRTHTTGTSTNAQFSLNRTGHSVPDNASLDNVLFYMASAGYWEGYGRNFSQETNYSFNMICNTSENDGWNLIGVRRQEGWNNSELNDTFNGGLFDATSSFKNNETVKYQSYFANYSFRKAVNATRGETVWMRYANSSASQRCYNWTNQTIIQG